MAAKKKVDAKKKAASAKETPAKAATQATLTKADVALLMKLVEVNTARPDVSIRDAVQEGKDLSAACTTLGAKLVSHGGISKTAFKELEARTARLDRGERSWTNQRDFAAKGDILTVRKAGVSEKQTGMAAMRHFLRNDREIQVRLDNIAEGSGDVDLADDLNKLADLIEPNLAALKTPEITKATPVRMREIAGKLSALVSERNVDVEAGDAITLRNKAFWHLRALVSEIQSAGRFVFRDEPKSLKHFRSIRARK